MVMFQSQFGGFAARPGKSWLQAVRNSWRRAELNPPAISRLLGIGLRSSRDRFSLFFDAIDPRFLADTIG
jgi:hypothetical protein